MTALKRTTMSYKKIRSNPNTSHKSPNRTENEAITFERGVTHDLI